MKRGMLLSIFAIIFMVIAQSSYGNCQDCRWWGGRAICVHGLAVGWNECTQPDDKYHCTVGGGPCPGGGGGCFLAGVMVNTRNGLMPIEQLKVGDEVLGFQDGKLQYCTVSHIYRSYQPYYFIINGSIKVTGSHPFWVDGGWIQAEYIELGDILLSKDLKPVVVQSKIQVDEPVRVFNIEVDNAHTFFVQDILVHNKKKPDE